MRLVGRWWHAFWYGSPRRELEPTSPFHALARAVAAFLMACGSGLASALVVFDWAGASKPILADVVVVGSLLVFAGLAVRWVAAVSRHGPVDLSPLDPQ